MLKVNLKYVYGEKTKFNFQRETWINLFKYLTTGETKYI